LVSWRFFVMLTTFSALSLWKMTSNLWSPKLIKLQLCTMLKRCPCWRQRKRFLKQWEGADLLQLASQSCTSVQRLEYGRQLDSSINIFSVAHRECCLNLHT
jgi:hypothetical protein